MQKIEQASLYRDGCSIKLLNHLNEMFTRMFCIENLKNEVVLHGCAPMTDVEAVSSGSGLSPDPASGAFYSGLIL